MTGRILQRPEGIRRKEIAAQITATKTTGVSIMSAIALGITVRLLGNSEGLLCEGKYLLNWPFLRLTDPFQFSKCPFDEAMAPSHAYSAVCCINVLRTLGRVRIGDFQSAHGGFFVDPGKYEFYSCEQIAANRKAVEAREQQLKLLMDKAEKGAGGAVVNVIA